MGTSTGKIGKPEIGRDADTPCPVPPPTAPAPPPSSSQQNKEHIIVDETEPDVVLIVPAEPEGEPSDDPDNELGRSARELDERHSTREIPRYFSGLAASATEHGLTVHEMPNPVRRPGGSVLQIMAGHWVPLMTLASTWVIFILSNKDARYWLKHKASTLWHRLIRNDNDAVRVAVVDGDGPIPQDYSLTFAVLARLPDKRIVQLHFREGCSESEFKRTLSLFSDYLADKRNPPPHPTGTDRAKDSTRILLALGDDGRLEHIDPSRLFRTKRPRIEPTVTPPKAPTSHEDP